MYIPVYPGSLDRNSVACAIIVPSNNVIAQFASTFSAEICAIIKALEEIKHFLLSKYIVYTD